ncbi:MAG: GGDEF domain-containing protein [Deltaproteobacteria bacterium]|nr:GGDEF domain-containing protein [Deltaproteobacteria bacterium]
MTSESSNFFCSDELVRSLIRAGVPARSKWGALILYMRSLSEYDFLSVAQKQALQDLVMEAVRNRDYSEGAFTDLVRHKEQILYQPWSLKLETMFRETVALIEHARSQNILRTKEVRDLRETTIGVAVDQNVLEDMIARLQAAFTSVITHMEQDTRDLVEMSYTDPLTKLNNRRAFDRYFQTTITESLLTKRPLSLLMVDIDHFKKFNDTYGHRIGDQALVTVAGKLMGYAKKYGTTPNRAFFPARYGGEEFVVVLPGFDAREAARDAENLRVIIADYDFIIRDHNGQVLQKGIKLTVSIGVAELRPGPEETALVRLLDEADHAMYQAKAGGRNRVWIKGD